MLINFEIGTCHAGPKFDWKKKKKQKNIRKLAPQNQLKIEKVTH